YEAVTGAGLRWKRSEQAFLAPWTPEREDFLREQFDITELMDDDTDLVEVAAGRAEHYDWFSRNADDRSAAAFAAAREISDGIPLGQPILAGHHSEKRHRHDMKLINSRVRRGVEEGKRAEYWKARAATTLARAERREMPAAIYRRIERLETDERMWQRTLESLRNQPPDAAPEIAAMMPEMTLRCQRWLAFLGNRLAYEQALYATSGGIAVERKALPLEVGGAVSDGRVWWPVTRVNRKSVSITGWLGVRNMAYRISLEKIKVAMTKAEWEAAEKVLVATGWHVSSVTVREVNEQ
ncbi:MAG: DUF3560 domain-containing protein, partial [Anaerolineales bacterium]|nr:DUF3560 domain-containing protein [Anaerolineales bacterium]